MGLRKKAGLTTFTPNESVRCTLAEVLAAMGPGERAYLNNVVESMLVEGALDENVRATMKASPTGAKCYKIHDSKMFVLDGSEYEISTTDASSGPVKYVERPAC